MQDKDITIVTGASRGIGKGIALKLAGDNHNVMLFGRDVKALQNVQEMVKERGAESEFFSGDAADSKFVYESVKKILSKYGKVDHLINNAGIGIMKKFVDSTLDDFKKQVDVNLYGVYNFTKAVINDMIKRKKGSVINIASLAGKNSFVGGTMYSATKHALLGFTRSLMLEVREYNIRVASICPGSVDTSFNTGPIDPRSRGEILKPEDVADALAAILKMPPRALMSEIDLRPTNPK